MDWTYEEKVMLFAITYSTVNNNNLKCIYKHIHCHLKYGVSKIFLNKIKSLMLMERLSVWQ